MNRAAVAQAELAISIADNKLDLALLQEPVVYKGRLIQLPPGFEGFPSRTSETRPRAAIYAKKSLKLIELNSLQSPDCAVALMKLNGRQTVIASCYLDYTFQEVIPNKVLEICQYAASNNFPLLIGAHSMGHRLTNGARRSRSSFLPTTLTSRIGGILQPSSRLGMALSLM